MVCMICTLDAVRKRYLVSRAALFNTEYLLHTLYLCSKATPTFILKSQNWDVFEFGKDLWISCGSDPPLRQGHLDSAAQDHIQMPFDCLLSTTTSVGNLCVKQFKTTKPQTDKNLTHCASWKSKVYFCMCENKLMNIMESSCSDFNIAFLPQRAVQSSFVHAHSHICSEAELLSIFAVKGCKSAILERKIHNTS